MFLISPFNVYTVRYTHQFPDASMLSDSAPGSSEFSHVGDGLRSQTFEVLVRVTQNLHHGL